MGDPCLPEIWRRAFQRDAEEKPAFADPLPERRLARLLAAFILSGLFFMIAPGTLLGVWNLLGISSQRGLAAIPAAWIQAHGHAQFFGWVGTFIIGISLHSLPKFRGGVTRSIPAAWAMWAMWTAGVGLRWLAGIQAVAHPVEFRVSAVLELAVAVLLVWQCSGVGPKHSKGQVWEIPVFSGFAALILLAAWQLYLAMQPLTSGALPLTQDRTLISLAIWAFALPVVFGYSLKFFPGLMGAAPAHRAGVRLALVSLLAAAAGFVADLTPLAAAGALAAALLACWSVRIFDTTVGKPKTNGVDPSYPRFVRISYGWLVAAAALGFGVARPGMLGASRHAFTVGFLATLIFAIGPRILPSFLNSRELWSARLMRVSLVLLTAGCALRVTFEPLAYGANLPAAWKVLPVSAFVEMTAVLLFGLNIAMSLAAPVPSWFGRQHVNDRMSVYWLVSSYPATRRLLVESGLATLGQVKQVPKSLLLRDAAEADGVAPEVLVERLGAFFDARLAPSLRGRDAKHASASGRRRSLVFPREHGAWGILLVPLITGAAAGLIAGGRALPLVQFCVAALALFWLRTPVESRAGTAAVRAHTPEEFRLVRRAILALSTVSAVALAWLFWGGRNLDLLWLGAAAAAAFVAQAILKKAARHLRTAAEICGAAGLTVTAPAAYYVVTGHLNAAAWALWTANLLFAANQIQFVQVRVHAARAGSTREKLEAGRWFLAGQTLLIALLAEGWAGHFFPWTAAIAFVPVLLRGFAWFATPPKPLDIRALGWSELMQAGAFGVLLVLGL